MSRLYDVESDAEIALASIVPTTLGGIMALLQYGADREEKGDRWRDDLFDKEDEGQRWGRSWWYFVNRNVVAALRDMTDER